MEETIAEVVETTAETITPEQAEKIIELLEDITAYLAVNEQLMYYIVGGLVMVFLWGAFKFFKMFLGMFF